MPRARRSAALDTSFLWEVHEGNEKCLQAVDALEKLGYVLIITDAVGAELQDIVHCDADPGQRRIGSKVLATIASSTFVEASLDSLKAAFAERAANALCEDAKIPLLNHARIIAEACWHKCDFLLTTRPALLNSNRVALRIVLTGYEVNLATIIDPGELLDSIDGSPGPPKDPGPQI